MSLYLVIGLPASGPVSSTDPLSSQAASSGGPSQKPTSPPKVLGSGVQHLQVRGIVVDQIGLSQSVAHPYGTFMLNISGFTTIL